MKSKNLDRYYEVDEYYVANDQYDYYRVDYNEYYVPAENARRSKSGLKSALKWGLKGGLAAAGFSIFI